ncbi:MAG: hypothetical protein HY567_04025 [Candidatus Kerfeldbacteria bacterium]|nr:hypothetical protein [Candidatus Kerfeldbacteria bacterium]
MAIDWTNVVKKYRGLWIGFKEDEKTVIASGKTVQEVLSISRAKGYPKPILFRVPTRVLPYIGIGSQ